MHHSHIRTKHNKQLHSQHNSPSPTNHHPLTNNNQPKDKNIVILHNQHKRHQKHNRGTNKNSYTAPNRTFITIQETKLTQKAKTPKIYHTTRPYAQSADLQTRRGTQHTDQERHNYRHKRQTQGHHQSTAYRHYSRSTSPDIRQQFHTTLVATAHLATQGPRTSPLRLHCGPIHHIQCIRHVTKYKLQQKQDIHVTGTTMVHHTLDDSSLQDTDVVFSDIQPATQTYITANTASSPTRVPHTTLHQTTRYQTSQQYPTTLYNRKPGTQYTHQIQTTTTLDTQLRTTGKQTGHNSLQTWRLLSLTFNHHQIYTLRTSFSTQTNTTFQKARYTPHANYFQHT